MAYIGRDTDKISNVEVLDNITFDGSSSYTLQKGGSNFTPSSANTLLLSIDGVVQAGNFTVSGSTIDFGTAVAGTSTCDFVLHYGVGLITTPSDGTVTTAKLADSSVTTAKLNDASVSLAKLTATGTKDATTFLRGDNTFSEAGGKFESQLLHVRDIKIYATSGGSSVSGSQVRDINTVEKNEISGASLSSNQITLPAGTYFIQATAPCYKSNSHKAVLHNVTSGAVNAVGTVEYNDSSDNVQTSSFINKRFTISGTSVFEIRHFISVAKSTNGLGIGYNVASTNVYTEVMIWKVA
jgi:hypothetical protein